MSLSFLSLSELPVNDRNIVYHELLAWIHSERSEMTLEQLISDMDKWETIIACVDGIPAGTVAISNDFIFRLLVFVPMRNQGIGTRLLKEAERHGGKYLGCNDAMIPYYMKRGFIKYGADCRGNWMKKG